MILLIGLVGGMGFSFVNTGVVYADEGGSSYPMPGTKCPDTSYFGDDICPEDTMANDVIPNLIIMILNWALVGVGTIVIIVIVIGGIMYMTAAGDAGKAKNGVKMIKNAIFALALYLIMLTFLNFIIPGGLFSGT